MTGFLSNSGVGSSTVSTRTIEIPEIALWIFSFIENDKDKASFSAVRRNVYHFLLEHRVKKSHITAWRSPSFALLLQNNIDAARSCTSLTVLRYFMSHQLFDVRNAFRICCAALALRTISESGGLKHFSGRLMGWYPEAEILSKTEVLEVRHAKKVNVQFGDVKASRKELDDALAALHRGDKKLTIGLHKHLLDYGLTGNVDNLKFKGAIFHELQKSSVSLEELSVDFSLDAWRALCSGGFPVLRRLKLITSGATTDIRISSRTPLLKQPIPTNTIERLEALKLVIHIWDSPILLLSINCPHLKLFEIGGTGRGGVDHEASLFAVESFIEHHPTLETVSLSHQFVPSTIKESHNIVALKYALPESRQFSNLPTAMHLTNVRHACLVFASQDVFFPRIPSKDAMRHIRCLELRFSSIEDSEYLSGRSYNFNREQQTSNSPSQKPTHLTKTVSQVMPAFSELVELAVHLNVDNKTVLAVRTDIQIIFQILAGCCDSDSLLAIKFNNTVRDGFRDDPVNSFDVPIAPPNLRFIALGIDGKEELYDVQSQAGGKIAIRRPFRRQFPVEGKWTVDFTDESIFDHFTGDYSNPKM